MALNRNEIFRTVGWTGAVLLLAAGLRYSVEGIFSTLVKVLLVAGAALLLISIVALFRSIVSFFSRRSSKLGTNTGVLVVVVLAILGIINFLGYRHHKRYDLTSEKLYTLSDQTRKIAGGLKTDVDVYSFVKTPDQSLNDLMAEYSNLSPHIHYHVVDPQEHPELAKQYGIDSIGQAVAVVGVRNQRLDGKDEQDVTGAILKLTRDSVKTICFVEGHSEKSISGENASYSTVTGELVKEGYQTKVVNLVSAGTVPTDCSVLVDAGPVQPLFPQEVTMIQQYLDNSGKALLMIDPQTDPKLEPIFTEWNISAPDNIAVDASGVGRLFGIGPAAPLVVDYGDSPITKNFQRAMTFFPMARTVSIADKSKTDMSPVELLKTSQASFAVDKITNNEVKFDPATDMRGPLSLGVTAEMNQNGKDARLVVIGDSDFASDQWSRMARNGDLFYNIINWLAQDENLISIRPRNPQNRRVDLTEAQQRSLQWFTVLLLPGIVILTGIYIWWKRR
jgi:ABC-type uncharacterized transport system involved in gliding motility auxiliary subunit